MVIRGEGGSAQACFCLCFGETGKWLHAQNLTHFWVHFKLSRRVKAIICEHALVICQKASWQGIEQNTCIYILIQATKTYCTLQQTHYICTQLLCLLCEVLHFTSLLVFHSKSNALFLKVHAFHCQMDFFFKKIIIMHKLLCSSVNNEYTNGEGTLSLACTPRQNGVF